MKFNHFLFTLASVLLSVHASAQVFDWAHSFGGADTDVATWVSTDSAGNVYTAGLFHGTVDFDPGPGTAIEIAVGTSHYVQKLSADGNFLWVSVSVSSFWERLTGLAVDADGNVVVAFVENGTNSADSRVRKLDSNGALLWEQVLTGFDSFSIATDSVGDLFIGGRNAGNDGVVRKLDPTGAFVTEAVFVAPFLQAATVEAVTLDDLGNVYACGTYYGQVDFDPGPGVQTLDSMPTVQFWTFALKLNAAMELDWAFSLKTYDDAVPAIAVDGAKNVWVATTYGAAIDADPGPGSVMYNCSGGGRCGLIVKVDAAGNYSWSGDLDAIGYSVADAVSADGAGAVVVAGSYDGTCDFDPGPATNNLVAQGLGANAYVLQLDTSGTFQYQSTVPGNGGASWARSVATTESGAFVVSGSFTANASLDPTDVSQTTSSMGDEDVFVQRFIPCVTSSILDTTVCVSFLSPSGTAQWTETGQYTDVIANAAGCDSIITVNLTIDVVDDSVVVDGALLTYAGSGTALQWFDCANGFTPITGATSGQYVATSDGAFAVEIQGTSCTDTSECYMVTSILEHGALLWRAFPNPTAASITIEWNTNPTTLHVRQLNAVGQQLKTWDLSNEQRSQIDLAGADGLYWLEITSGETIVRHPVIKSGL